LRSELSKPCIQSPLQTTTKHTYTPRTHAPQHGPNISPEGLGDGFTHAFLMTFADAAARDAYLPHPLHEAFKDKHLPHVAKVFVLDI